MLAQSLQNLDAMVSYSIGQRQAQAPACKGFIDDAIFQELGDCDSDCSSSMHFVLMDSGSCQ